MNRQKLETVRDEVHRLDAAPSCSDTAKATHETLLAQSPERVSPIDTLDMNTWHSRLSLHGNCRTLGCIAGVTVCLYPEETRRIATENEDETPPPSIGDIAQQILELDDAQAYALFHSEPRRTDRVRATPEDAAAAIDRLLAGDDPDQIWSQGGTTA